MITHKWRLGYALLIGIFQADMIYFTSTDVKKVGPLLMDHLFLYFKKFYAELY